MSISIYKQTDADFVFIEHGAVGTWPYHCLQAIGNGDGTVSINNVAKTRADDTNYLEIANVAFADYIDESGDAWGASEVLTVNNLNNMFASQSGGGGVAPVYTSATAVTVADTDVVNYFADATGGVGWEWGTLPAGLSVSSSNPRNLLGVFDDGTGSSPYSVDVTATNYFGSTTTSVTFTVTATFANTKSVKLKNNDYLSATANSSNPLYRAANGAGAGDAWTISSWFKPPTSNNNEQSLLYFGGDSESSEGGVWVYYRGSDDHLRLRYGSSDEHLLLETPDDSLTPGSWSHIFVTYDGGTTGRDSGDLADYYGRFEIWIDGVSQTLTKSHDNNGCDSEIVADVFRIGEYGNSSKHMRDGYVDELAIWEGDETANVAAIYNSGSTHDLSLLGSAPDHWWRMGDGDTYPTLTDNVGSLNFTMNNMSASEIVTDAP